MSAEQVFEVLQAGRDYVYKLANTSVKLSRRGAKYMQMVTIGLKRYPGWQDKAYYRWTTPELVDFCLQHKNDFHIGIKFITRLVKK